MPSPAAATPAFTAYQKFLVAVLALIQFTVILDFMVLSPLGDELMKALHIGPTQFSHVVSAYAFSAGAAGLLSAGFADRFDRKKLLLFFYVGFVVGTLGCGLATSYYTLLAARVVAGLFGGVIGSVSLAIVADEFAPALRGRVMGTVQMGFAVSQVAGIPLALWLAAHWDWHAPFLLIVGLALVIGVAVWVRMRPVTGHLALQTSHSAFGHLWGTLRRADYQTGFLAIALLSIGGFMLMPFGSAFLINNVGITPKQLPVVYLATGISSLVVMPLVGRLADRYGRFRLFAIGSVMARVTVVFYTQLGPTPLWAVVAFNVVMFAGVMSRIVPATALNASVADPADRGAYSSVTSSLQQVAGGIGAVAAGAIVQQATPHSPLEHYPVLGVVVASVFVLCLWLVYRVSQLVAGKQAAEQRETVREPPVAPVIGVE